MLKSKEKPIISVSKMNLQTLNSSARTTMAEVVARTFQLPLLHDRRALSRLSGKTGGEEGQIDFIIIVKLPIIFLI